MTFSDLRSIAPLLMEKIAKGGFGNVWGSPAPKSYAADLGVRKAKKDVADKESKTRPMKEKLKPIVGKAEEHTRETVANQSSRDVARKILPLSGKAVAKKPTATMLRRATSRAADKSL
jgi:hypothetical protein